MKLAVQGSCVSRDLFWFVKDDEIVLTRYGARSSFAILALPKLKGVYDYTKLTSNFQKRMVQDDHQRNFPDNLERCEFDTLLIDFIDERFDLVNIDNKGIVTCSQEFSTLDEVKNAQSIKRIRAQTRTHTLLILQGLEKLSKKLASLGKSDRCYINKVFYATHNELGQPLTSYSKKQIEEANQFLQKLYGTIEILFPEMRFISYDSTDFIANSQHRWGEAPFHYVDEFYCKTIKYLKEISNNN